MTNKIKWADITGKYTMDGDGFMQKGVKRTNTFYFFRAAGVRLSDRGGLNEQ